MASPTFFGEGNTPRVHDTRWRILQKILGSLIDLGGGGGGGGGGGLQCAIGMWPVDTIVELRQIDVVTCPPQWARTAGNLVKFDAQGSEYFYDPDSTDADDGMSVIKPDIVDASAPGRWRQIS